MTSIVFKYKKNDENEVNERDYNKILALDDYDSIHSLIINNDVTFNKEEQSINIEKFPLQLRKLELIRIPFLLKNIKIPNYLEELKIQLSYKDSFNNDISLDKLIPPINYNLRVLDLSNNRLEIIGYLNKMDNIHKLPETIKSLNLSNNYINNDGLEILISVLPSNLEELNLEGNAIDLITSISNKFPDSIKNLNLNNNDINFIDNLLICLSDNIEILNLNNNDLKGFANKENMKSHKLPKNLRELYLEYNYCLDENMVDLFPDTLKYLSLSGCDINKNLKKFPDNIEELNISKIDNFKFIREGLLPKNLKRLDVSDTSLNRLPDFLPDKLEYINCENTSIIKKPILDNIEVDYYFDENNVTFICHDCKNEIMMLDCRYREGLSGINYCEKCFNSKNQKEKKELNKIVTVYNNNWYCDSCEYSFCCNDIRKHIHYKDYDICMKCYREGKGKKKYKQEEYTDTLSYYINNFDKLEKTIELQKKICNNDLIETINSFRKDININNLQIIKYLCKKENINIQFTDDEIKFILERKIIYLIDWAINLNSNINNIDLINSLSVNSCYFMKYININTLNIIEELEYKNLIEKNFIDNTDYDSFNYLLKLREIKNGNYDIHGLIDNYISLYNKEQSHLIQEYDESLNNKIQLLDNMFYKIKWYICSNIKENIINNDFIIKCCEMNNYELLEILLKNIKIIEEDTLYKCFIQGCHNNNVDIVRVIYERDENIINRINTYELLVLCIEDEFYNLFKYLYEILNKCDLNQNNYYIFKEICKYYENNINYYNTKGFVDWFYELKNEQINLSYNNEEFTYLSCINNNIFMFNWLIKKKPDINISIDNDKIFMDCNQNELWNICEEFVKLKPEYFKKEYIDYDVSYSINRVLTLIDNEKNTNIEICNICMDNNSDCLTKCNHQFCKNCLDIWYKKNNKCPYCREYLENVVYKL